MRIALLASVIAIGTSMLTGRARAAELVAPVVIEKVAPAYPSDAPADKHVDAIVEVTLDEQGRIVSSKVVSSAGEPFDGAALEALARWSFHPATRDGAPIRSKIRVTLHFAPPSPPQPVLPPATQSTPPAKPAPTKAAAPEARIHVVGETDLRARGASDFPITVGALRYVPRVTPNELLKLAPGILLTNEGGEGHPEQVFLRGFDAREGQDIEFSVSGVPINDVGNLHGGGVADTHFIIPEAVTGLRVVEGPFAPQQGNYAVAGSADYRLGMERRGLTTKLALGSFGSQRLLMLFARKDGPPTTFGAAEIYQTDGFGMNRDARRGKALAQVDTTAGRFTATAYSARYHSAGVLRDDDLRRSAGEGRVGFFDTYDTMQGGESSRYSLAWDWDGAATDDVIVRTTAFLVLRSMRTRKNLTGFLLDHQTALQPLRSEQRGDLLDTLYDATVVGMRGLARVRGRAFGLPQEYEVGWLARGDFASSAQHRLQGAVPYAIEDDLESKTGNLGLYADASLRPARLVTLRGGARAELFTFDVMNRCAVRDVPAPSASRPPGEQSCYAFSRGDQHREPFQRVSTASVAAMPRVTLLFGPIQHMTLSVSAGRGIRSIDPQYITQDADTPFASIKAYEAGVAYARSSEALDLVVRSVFFQTHVDRDLVFSQVSGRNVLSGGTTRTGWVGAVRARGKRIDQSASATLVRSTFDETGLLVPYVPDLVVRSDTAAFLDLPYGVRTVFAAGVSYIGRRALPFGERSDRILTVDASITAQVSAYEVALTATNLFDARYRLGEYNYVSDFHSQSNPTLVPARHFTAGAPRAVFLTLGVTLGGS